MQKRVNTAERASEVIRNSFFQKKSKCSDINNYELLMRKKEEEDFVLKAKEAWSKIR